MKVLHIALWVNNLEMMKDFYCHFFNGIAVNNYQNEVKNFESWFVYFESGISLELMCKTNKVLPTGHGDMTTGFHHLAFSVGNCEEVDQLTLLINKAGYTVKSKPRITGDGFYESVIVDPEGNTIEITV